MRPSKAYKDWIRRCYLNKFDIRLLTQIASYKAGVSGPFKFGPTKKKRLEEIKDKVKDIVKNDVYSFKDKLTEEENFKLNDVVAEIVDFTDTL